MITTAECFAGFGGFRAACDQNGIETVWACEIDPHARMGYQHFWGDELDAGDINDVTNDNDASLLPDHDLLTGGFPCCSFSLAGVPKLRSLGREDGFRDITRGTLFFNLCDILDKKRPKAFVFENVKNLKSHDGGYTMLVIKHALSYLDYNTRFRIIDAANWVPQHRERTFIVGFREDLMIEPTIALWDIDIPATRPVDLADILEPEPDPKYTLMDGTWAFHQRHKARSKENGKRFGYGLIEPPFEGKVTRTLSHRYHKDGAEILIAQPGRNPRMLTPLECLRLQGFPSHLEAGLYQAGLSDARLWMGFGNAIAVPTMAAVIGRVRRLLEDGN